MNQVDFVSGWEAVWGPLRSAIGGQVVTILAVVGVLIIVVAVLGHLWQRRKGGAFSTSHTLLVPVLVGAILCGPDVVVPILLNLLQSLINVVLGLVNSIVS